MAVKRGLHRSLMLVLDLGRAMGGAAGARDLAPSRLAAAVGACEAFVRRYRDEGGGGVAQMGLCVLRNSEARVVAPLGSSPARCLAELRQAAARGCDGETSLQNGLRAALRALEGPARRHTTREVVVVLAALTLCDPADVHAEIRAAAAARVRCSVVALAAELHVCALLAQQTGGSSTVALNAAHLRALLCAHVTPPPLARDDPAHLIPMGFPHYFSSQFPSFCAWFVSASPLIVTGCVFSLFVATNSTTATNNLCTTDTCVHSAVSCAATSPVSVPRAASRSSTLHSSHAPSTTSSLFPPSTRLFSFSPFPFSPHFML